MTAYKAGDEYRVGTTDAAGNVETQVPAVTVSVANGGLTKSVWAWGDNEYGQLGNNSTTDSSTPVGVYGLDYSFEKG